MIINSKVSLLYQCPHQHRYQKMATLKFIHRTGKDLFEYMSLSTINQDRANEAALEKFVEIDGKPLATTDIFRLKVEVRDRLIGSVFSMKNPESFFIDNDVAYYTDINGKDWIAQKKKVKYSLLTEIQTKFADQSERKNYIKALKDAVSVMFDISTFEIDLAPYQFIAGLINEVNSFLTICTQSKNQFDVDDSELFDT